MSYEELTAGLNLCSGERKGSRLPCRGSLYKCSACGQVGCRQTQNDACTTQGFSAAGRCLHCGAANSAEVAS
ncbi:hypothetical protein [Piscinibacter sp.]|jgi:hypothetical protein|uniref:hypothetical protein n=1 Tax=Piscinibacter sp. TaxID=1903157 RepID=UPI003559CF03